MIEFGKELQELRNSKGITLEHIAKVSRVNIEFLRKLEEGDFNFMPQIYIRSFLKEYLEVLDVDSALYLKKYDEYLKPGRKSQVQLNKQQTEIKAEKVEQKKEIASSSPEETGSFTNLDDNVKVSRPRYLLISTIVIVLFLLIALIFLKDIKNLFSETETKNSGTDKIERFSEVQEKEAAATTSVENNKNKLVVSATEKVWLQVSADGKVVESLFLLAGEEKSWYSEKYFDLVIGSVGSVSLNLNGKQVPLTGGVGLVRKIRLDTSGVTILKFETPNKKNEKKNGFDTI